MAEKSGRAAQRPFFVYGTLLPGQPNAYLWGNSIVSAQPAVFSNGRLHDMGHYPMLVTADGAQVQGQVIAVETAVYDTILHALDELEGYDPAQPQQPGYQRQLHHVTRQDGQTVAAWVYLGQADLTSNCPTIPSGDWRQHVANSAPDLTKWWETISTVAGLHQAGKDNTTHKSPKP